MENCSCRTHREVGGDAGADLRVGVSVRVALLQDVALDPGAAVRAGSVPPQGDGVLCHLAHLQVVRRAGATWVCTEQKRMRHFEQKNESGLQWQFCGNLSTAERRAWSRFVCLI